jgi:hypothetical protein
MIDEKYNPYELTRLKMGDKIDKSLGKVILCFFTNPRTITEVTALTNVSRTTVYKFMKTYLKNYLLPVDVFRTKGKKYILSNDLVIRVIGNSLNFNEDELSCIRNLLEFDEVKTLFFDWNAVKSYESFDKPFSHIYIRLWIMMFDVIGLRDYYKGKIHWKDYSEKEFGKLHPKDIIDKNQVKLIKKIITPKKFKKYEKNILDSAKETVSMWKIELPKDATFKLSEEMKQAHPRYVYLTLAFPKSLAEKIIKTNPWLYELLKIVKDRQR